MTAPVGSAEVVEAASASSTNLELKALARGGALNVAGAVISSSVNILLVLLVTRQLTKTAAGVFFASTSIFLITATVAKLGANTGLVYHVARLRALGRPDLVTRCLRHALVPVVLVSLLGSVILWIVATPFGKAVNRADAAQAIIYIRILAVFLTVAALSDVCLAATRGFRKMRPTVLLDSLGRPALQLALTALVLYLHVPLGWLAVAWAAPYLPEAIAAALWLSSVRRRNTRGLPTGEGDFRAREFWRFTGPRAVSSIVQLALQRFDIILLAVLRGPVDAALYTAATRFLVVGQLGGSAISTVVQPRLSELLALGDRDAAKSIYQVATGWLVLVTWPLYLLVVVFSTQLLALFGRGYAAGSKVVVLLAAAMLVATICGMVDVVLNMAGRTAWTLGNSVLALAVNVGLDLLLIPGHGILGAAIGWSTAIVVNNLLPLAQITTSLGLHPFGHGTLLAAALAGVSFAGVPLLARLLLGTTTAAVLAAVVVGTGVYAATLFWLRRPLALDVLRSFRRPGRRQAATTAISSEAR